MRFRMYEYVFRATTVYDGDTIHAHVDLGLGVWILGTDSRGIGDRYRLARINAPELGTPEGAASRDYLAYLLGPLPALLTGQTTLDRRDNYGRVLVDLIAMNGDLISDKMVKAGHAVYYPSPA